jgi:uncharacterized protein
MFIDINEIEREGVSFDLPLDLSGVTGTAGDGLRVIGTRMAGRAERGDIGVALRARLEAKVELGCSRCTEPFRVDLAIAFYLTLVPEATEFATGETRIQEEDASLYYTKEHKADLVQIATEQIYLNLPLKPVCKDDCKGLCPQCGANRNCSACGCAGETLDPRLAPLLQFKKRP